MIIEAPSPFSFKDGELLEMQQTVNNVNVNYSDLSLIDAAVISTLDLLLVSTGELLVKHIMDRGYPASPESVSASLERLTSLNVIKKGVIRSQDHAFMLTVFFLDEQGKTFLAKAGRIPYQPWVITELDITRIKRLLCVQQFATAMRLDYRAPEYCIYNSDYGFLPLKADLIRRSARQFDIVEGVRREHNWMNVLHDRLDKIETFLEKEHLTSLLRVTLVCERKAHQDEVFEFLDHENIPYHFRIRLSNDNALADGDLMLSDWYQGCLMATIRRRNRS